MNRIAWPMKPAFTSSQRIRPGKIGSPAASALVHVDGRSALVFRWKIAPLPAVG